MSFTIGAHRIGRDEAPFIIAEMSGNHNQSLDRALAIVDAIADSGAQALKLQTYTADTMTIDVKHGDFLIDDVRSPWHGETLYQLYQKAFTPWEWHQPLFAHAKKRGLVVFSTPFDETAVDFLETLEVPVYKISSFENIDHALICKAAATGKPLIISTGNSTIADIDESVRVARAAGCKDLILLKCTSSYPASPISSNITTIPHLRSMFNCEVGLSDHTLGIGAAVASVALGACVIEKHVTLSRNSGGVDDAFSLEPSELRQLVAETKTAWQSLGNPALTRTEEETSATIFKRSLYICDDLVEGSILTTENLRSIRPGLGLSPKYRDQLLGKRVCKPVKRGTKMTWDLIG